MPEGARGRLTSFPRPTQLALYKFLCYNIILVMSPESFKDPAPQKPTLARRFGGYFLGMLAPAESMGEKSAKELAVDRENELIDQRQQAHFHANLLRVVGPSTAENMHRLTIIKQTFEAELAETHSIAERFNLFREPFYASFVNTLDLGETKRPDSHEEVAALKQEYHVMLEQLVAEKLVDGELPRAKARPSIHLSTTSAGEYVSATRNRELFSYTDGIRTLSVAKRMTFLIPDEVVACLEVPSHGKLNRHDTRSIERLIDAEDAEKIIPVRTLYYAKSKPIVQTAA